MSENDAKRKHKKVLRSSRKNESPVETVKADTDVDSEKDLFESEDVFNMKAKETTDPTGDADSVIDVELNSLEQERSNIRESVVRNLTVQLDRLDEKTISYETLGITFLFVAGFSFFLR